MYLCLLKRLFSITEEPRLRNHHALKHPELVGRKAVFVICLALTILSLIGFFLVTQKIFWLGLVLWALTWLYSYHPQSFKRHSWRAELAHLIWGELCFLQGWLVFSNWNPKSVLLGIFFGLILSSGNLANGVEHFEQDLKGGYCTTAIKFGRAATFNLSRYVFFLSSGYLILISLVMDLPRWFGICGLVLALFWISNYFLLDTQKGISRIKSYRASYRILYGALILVMMIILGLQKL